ncbi:MAG: hypothetical protein Q8P20_05930 [bacterium]|nr:hypothetical protein [bacterium]
MPEKFIPEFNNKDGSTPEEAKHVLSPKDIEELLKQADLSEKDFKPGEQEGWRLQASVYRQLIWELANIFAERQEGWTTEMTHSEYVRDPKTGEVKTLDLCLEFSEDTKDGEWEYRSYEKFRKFLEENPQIISRELRKNFDVYIGFNYGDQGGLLIKEKDMEMVTQEVLDAIKSDGMIGYADHRKENKFIKILREKLKEKFLPKPPETTPTPEQPKRKYKVLIEMEGYGKDGKEITGNDLYEEVIVEAATPDGASDVAANMDFGNRRVSYVEEPKLVESDEK